MTTIPTRDDADYAEQLTLAHETDRETCWDTWTVNPPVERIRTAFDGVDTTDRHEQSLMTPLPDDDYPFAY
ncbi:hypothetical protein [Nocardia sp. CA-120079]|uniref:hypothetical protein n=1 Tax=Nocardia sp. CA-120079 TaxID=3239974 RepID=UPI003D99B39A